MSWLLAVIGKPLGALLLFGFARILIHPLKRYLPEGRLRRILFFKFPTK